MMRTLYRRDVVAAVLAGFALLAPAAQAGPSKITLVAVGDVTLGNHFRAHDAQLRAGGATEDIVAQYPFAKVTPLFEGADIVLANYEGTFTDSTIKTPKNFNFRAAPAEVSKLQGAGIHIVSLANNHGFDYGRDGLADTMEVLDAAGIAHFGAGMNLDEARRYKRYAAGDTGVCFVGYLYLGNYRVEPATLWAGADKAGVAGVPPARSSLAAMRDMLGEDLDRMKADKGCPVRVVYFHWGREGRRTPKAYQRELAQFAADRGADLVLGAHPHVLQGTETLKAADGSRVPVVYSMGNFVFAGNWNPKNKNSVVVKATIHLDNGQRRRELELIPVFTDKFPATPFQPYPQTKRQARQLLQQIDCRDGGGTPLYCGTDGVDEADPDPLPPGITP